MSQGQNLRVGLGEPRDRGPRGGGGCWGLGLHPAGPDSEWETWPQGPLLGSLLGATRLWWVCRGSELVMVTGQVLAIVGGLAANEHVPVAQNLSLAQTPILERGSEVRGDKECPAGLCPSLSGSLSPPPLGVCPLLKISVPPFPGALPVSVPNGDPGSSGPSPCNGAPGWRPSPARPPRRTLSVSLSCSRWLASTSGWSWAGGSTQWPTSLPSSRPSLFRSRKSRNCSRSVCTQAGSSSPGSCVYRSAGVGGDGVTSGAVPALRFLT